MTGILCSFASLVSYFTRVRVPGRRSVPVAALSSPTLRRRAVTFSSFVRNDRPSPSHLYPPPTLFLVKSNVMWRPRGLGQPMNVSPVTSHGISGHKRATLRWRYTACSPVLRRPPSSHPSKSPYLRPLFLTLAREREAVFLFPPTEKRCLSVSRGEQGLEGDTIIYLLSLARPRTRVNHPRLRGYCFCRVAIPRYAREVRPAIDDET